MNKIKALVLGLVLALTIGIGTQSISAQNQTCDYVGGQRITFVSTGMLQVGDTLFMIVSYDWIDDCTGETGTGFYMTSVF